MKSRCGSDRPPLTVRVAEATHMLGIGKTKLYELIAQREIDTLKVGRATLIVVGSVHAFIERECALSRMANVPRRKHGRPRKSFVDLAASSRP